MITRVNLNTNPACRLAGTELGVNNLARKVQGAVCSVSNCAGNGTVAYLGGQITKQ